MNKLAKFKLHDVLIMTDSEMKDVRGGGNIPTEPGIDDDWATDGTEGGSSCGKTCSGDCWLKADNKKGKCTQTYNSTAPCACT